MASEKWEKYYRPQAERHRDAAEWILGNRCTACKTTRGPFEFDHIDRKTKSFNIGHKLHYSWEKVYQELRKCQLLCKTCHNYKTYVVEGVHNKGTAQHGSHYMTYDLGCRCYECLLFRRKRNESRRTTNITRPQNRELIHGTRAGYMKEKRLGQTPCAQCKQANAEYTKQLKAKKNLT